MRARTLAVAGGLAAILAAAADPARGAAPGWSTPHTVTPYRVGTYGVAPGPAGVQIFGNGAVQTMTAQMRAIRADGTQGSAVGVDAGAPGFDGPQLSVNDDARFVAAWALDTQGQAPIGLAATLGSRTSLPRSATVLPTDGQDVSGLATAIDENGNGVVVWTQSPRNASGFAVKAATLRRGQAPVVATLATQADANVDSLSVGLDAQARPTVTWRILPLGGPALLVGVARGDGTGAFTPAFEQALSTVGIAQLSTFATADGGLLAFWVDGDPQSGPVDVRFAAAPAGGALGAPQTVVGDVRTRGSVAVAANAAGRAAVLVPLASGNGTTSLRVALRTRSGTWGSVRSLGPSNRYVDGMGIGVDASGRVVALWSDGASRSTGSTRILAARSSSGSNPLGSYNQVSQRPGDRRCHAPTLWLATSGDGLGLWRCYTTSTGGSDAPRLARLTSPS